MSSILKNHTFRSVVIPGALTVLAPLFTLWLCVGLSRYSGAVIPLVKATLAAPGAMLRALPRPTEAGVQTVLAYVVVEAALLALIPGPGYLATITPAGDRPWYKLNGVTCYLLTLGGFLLGSAEFGFGWWHGGVLFDRHGELVASGSLVGLVLAVLFYVKGLTWPSGRDAGPTGHGLVWDFFHGTELHPTLFGLNMKQLVNCRVSMNGWALLALSFALKQRSLAGSSGASFLGSGVSPGMFVSVALLLVYLLKFFMWESGYFGSMDVQHDRFGFYLVWGLFAWVPSVYVTAALHLVRHPGASLSPGLAWLVLAVGSVAIYANWEADDQRQRVRESQGQCLVWGRKPQVIVAPYTTGDGKRHTSLLLYSGWWGISRHCHYLAELTSAFCWSCAIGLRAGPLPWFYFIFLTILLMDRAYRDEMRCAAKYKAAWKEYCARVPYRVIPFVY